MFRSHGTNLTVRKFKRLAAFKALFEQRENIEQSRVNEVSGQFVQSVKNSTGVV